jgi:predicted TIM-barrel enzyme
MLSDLDDEFVRQGRSRQEFEIIITPPYQVNQEMVEQYAELGVDRLVLHLGNQKPERITQRLSEVSSLVGVA